MIQSKKCVVVGNSECGKTTYVKKLFRNEFEKEYITSVGVEVYLLLYENYRFNVWDIIGDIVWESLFRGVRDGYLSIGADCGIVCFDLTSRDSFYAIPNWFNFLSRYMSNIVIVGFKSDLPHAISTKEIEDLVERLNVPCFEVSSKTGKNLYAPLDYFLSTF